VPITARNDNSERRWSFCSGPGLRIAGSWFKRKTIHWLSLFSNDSVTAKEIDHVLVNTRWTILRNCRVYRSLEFDTDHLYLWHPPWQFVVNNCHRKVVLHVPNSTPNLFKIRKSANSLKLRSETVSQYLMMMTSITVTQFKKSQKKYSGRRLNPIKTAWISDSTRADW